MKLELEISDDRVKKVIEEAMRDAYSWKLSLKSLVEQEAKEAVNNLPIHFLVQDYLKNKIGSILDDVVYKQIKHVVKIAVDRELSIAREVVSVTDSGDLEKEG